MKLIETILLAALLCLCLLTGCAAAPQRPDGIAPDTASSGTVPQDAAASGTAAEESAPSQNVEPSDTAAEESDPSQDAAPADPLPAEDAAEDPALCAALNCLVYLGEYAPATDPASVEYGCFDYHQQLTEAERAALTALLQPEAWLPLEEIPATDWFAASVCAMGDTSARLLLQEDLALCVTDSLRYAWALPEGAVADAAAFYAGLEAQGRDSLFPLDVTAFTEVGYDLEGPHSFDVRFPLTGELQQRFIDAIHPETWQRYELFLEVGWSISGLNAAAGDAVLTVYGTYDDGAATAMLYTPDGAQLYTVPAEECAAIQQLYADIEALPVD